MTGVNETTAKLQDEVEILRERVRQLEEALYGPAGRMLECQYRLGLTVMQSRFLGALMSREVVGKEALLVALYGDRKQDWPGDKTLDAHAFKLRQRLAVHGIELRTVRGIGYALDDAAKDRIRRIVGAEAA
ncbi:winged helix-turn-helix domain-containing protein [Kaustia mangrovi]|uniref:Winged helix-turn-helix domain-containing protein n=1 Tax=Kaustia mangrovi TaxID=2593653 RepID=A0A7S8C6V8_9HYPH|nr:helix-turn-helix domain-containing protein [Kaustia mangrovi]QPC44500.1 winged helix-turn-helix domain-containing protein [Kaustia mangrovi]